MPPRSENLLSKWAYPVGGGVVGFLTICVNNYYNRRPNFSGIQRHIVCAIAFSAAGYYIEQKLQAHYAERDAMVRHYMELHPEDFVQEKKKYRDIFEPWPPHR